LKGLIGKFITILDNHDPEDLNISENLPEDPYLLRKILKNLKKDIKKTKYSLNQAELNF